MISNQPFSACVCNVALPWSKHFAPNTVSVLCSVLQLLAIIIIITMTLAVHIVTGVCVSTRRAIAGHMEFAVRTRQVVKLFELLSFAVSIVAPVKEYVTSGVQLPRPP